RGAAAPTGPTPYGPRAAARRARAPGPAGAFRASPAGLLLVFRLRLVLAAERLAIGDLGLCRLGVHAELPRQAPDHDLEMALTESTDERLSQLAVELVVEGGILFVQLVEPGGELVLLAPLLHLDGHRDHRFGERDLREHEPLVLGRQRVVGVRVTQLGDNADVAGVQLGNLEPVLAHGAAQVIELLGEFAWSIPDILPVPDRAGKNPKQGHVTHVRLGDSLEDLRGQWAGVIRRKRYTFGAPPLLRFGRRRLVRRGA